MKKLLADTYSIFAEHFIAATDFLFEKNLFEKTLKKNNLHYFLR